MVCFSTVYYARARPRFFAARFFPVPFLPFIRPLHASQNLWSMSPSVRNKPVVPKHPHVDIPFRTRTSAKVVRPSQVRRSSEHSKHSAQFSLEIRFSMGEYYWMRGSNGNWTGKQDGNDD